MSNEVKSPKEARDITYCFVDGNGDEQIKHISDERGGQIGYAIDKYTARVWIARNTGEETNVFPLDRVVFIREVTRYIPQE